MKRLTSFEKIECAEYVLNILEDALPSHTPPDNETFELIKQAKEEVAKRRSQYLDNRETVGL